MQKEKVGKHIRSIIENAGEDASWFILLDTNRNFFIHDGAPYLSIDITEAPIRFDLLIWKEHLKNFDNPEKFVRLSEINDILCGFDFSERSYKSVYLKALSNCCTEFGALCGPHS